MVLYQLKLVKDNLKKSNKFSTLWESSQNRSDGEATACPYVHSSD